MLAVIDYDTGNVRNVKKALDYLNIANTLTSDPVVIAQADGLILPGVGAFQKAMAELEKRHLVQVLQQQAAAGQPMLGICLGMQLLFDRSEEFGDSTGLGLLPGAVVAIPEKVGLKVPHMGWDTNQGKANNRFGQIFDQEATYFVHSFYVQTAAKNIAATVNYGVTIPSVVQQNNVVGMQFHPEKSGQVGLAGLKAFKEMCADAAFSRN
ncbi:MAG: imidazole glycerol phosphate synthase subunit HisH [Lactobacillus sp.]|jgi:glutamine amidotransferase|nr:imidazole glycerol phosphate synthase subunit HisH [Lactobacillus sp.]MCI2033555.1 imidazole glycerol phosphate synthase subunit HisH [Lactobacillus sp.]